MTTRSTLLKAGTAVAALASVVALGATPAHAAGTDKYKSASCGTGGIKVWYRDYGTSTMLREITWDGDKFSFANSFWRADDGKKTFQSYDSVNNLNWKISDQQTSDIAVAKTRKPYVKAAIHGPFGTCDVYINLF
ncbi:hypothetical protein [Streptomyces sp. G-G2]|uniref:hypothetical protein n=1 Tax=Streptomyces sp. G-G2 TaxID=3046201 RepID=UPI0024BB2856|nr:hypothetical protein [Streptomyces sp. G-G2]MDJ0382941.1 hypothetical protein [Streptomyces sp. G-G2]